MIRLILLTLSSALVAGSTATAGGPASGPSKPVASGDEAPVVACALSTVARSERDVTIEELFSGSTETRELPDGYAFRFPGEPAWSERLLAFINGERECCRFFEFELVFEPDGGPVWLGVRGSKEIKAFIETLMG